MFLTGYINAQNILHVDKELRTPLNRAMTILKHSGIEFQPEDETFIVTYGKTTRNAVAIARGKDREGVYIIVNFDAWREYSELSKVWVMLHELGHDVFNLEHDDSKLSIMNTEAPSSITSHMWRTAKEDFINKLKQIQ